MFWKYLKNNIVIIALVVGIIGMILISASYLKALSHVVYVADDYSYARRIQEYGFLGAQSNWYASWSEGFTGRIMSTLLISLSVMSGQNFTGKFLVFEMIGIALLLIISFVILAKKISVSADKLFQYLIAIYIATLIVMSSVLIAPAPLQTTLWSAGLNIYLIPPLLIIAGAALIATAINRRHKSISPYIGLMLILFGCLSSESMSIAVFLTGSYLYILELSKKNKGANNENLALQRFIRLSLLLSVLTFLVQFGAPGTFVRRLYLTPSNSIVEIVQFSLQKTSTYLISTIVLHWEILILIVASGALCAKLIARENELADRLNAKTLASQISSAYMKILILGGIMMVPVYMASSNIPERSLMIVGNITIVVLLLTGFKFGATKWSNMNSHNIIVAVILLLMTIVVVHNFRSNYYYTRGIIDDYRIKSIEREKIIVISREEKITTFALPDYYRLGELDSDPKYWLNIEMARYYNKAELRSEK